MTSAESFVNRPVEELFARYPGYAFAGDGVHTATGNYTRTEDDLAMASGLIAWRRTYNSLSRETGILGRGWACSLGVRLDPGPAGRVALHDQGGRVLTFTARAGGGYLRPQDTDADLLRESDGSFVLRHRSGETWRFDASGRAVSRSADGERVDFAYNAEGLLETAAHSAGLRLSLAYDGGLLQRVTADDGRAVAYRYAEDPTRSLLAAVIRPDGSRVGYAATDRGQLASTTDADGIATVANTYDERGRVCHQDLAGAGGTDVDYAPPGQEPGTTQVTATPAGTLTVFGYDASGRTVRVTDPLGGTSTLRYDGNGRFVGGSTPGGTEIEQVWDERGDLVATVWGGAATTYAYDSAHRPTRVTDATGATTRFTYEGDGHTPATITDPSGAVTRDTVRDGLLVSRRDPDGGTWHYRYDDRRNLASTTDPTGATSRYAYDAAGRRTATTSPTGERSTCAYDAAGRPSSVTGPAGDTVRYTYTAAGRPLETVDPLGSATTRAYDAQGRLTATTDPLGARTAYSYDDAGHLSGITDPAGARTAVTHDELGRIATVTDPLGAVTRYGYDTDGNLATEQGPGGTTTTRFDQRGNPVEVTDPTGATTGYAYDGVGRLTALTDPLGGVWSTAYDAAERTVTRTGPDGASSTRVLDPSGRTTAFTDPLGRRTSYRHDAAGRLAEITDPEGGRTSFTYDADGRRLSTTTPAGLVERFEYDAGRLVATVDARGWITRYRYDGRGLRTEVVTPGGARTRYTHDRVGRLLTVTDPRGGVTRYEFDAMGRFVRVVDAKGAATTWTHDAVGRRTSATDPLGRTTRYEYDPAGDLTAIVDPAGRAVRREYDARGEVVRVVGDDGSEVRYSYDAAGRRVGMSDASGTTRYTYDAAGRLLTVTYPDGGVLGAGYDAAGQRTVLHHPDGARVRYRYDLAGRLVAVHDSQAGEAVYAVDPDGRLLTEQLPGGMARRYHYDGGLLARFLELRSGGESARTEFVRDPDGRIAVRTGHVAGAAAEYRYRYDPAGQLAAVTGVRPGEAAREVRVSYDVVGNRTSLTTTAGAHTGQTRYLYDAADQLIAVEHGDRRIGYRYDPAGRLTEEYDGDVRHTVDHDGLGLPVRSTRTRAWARESARATYNGDGLLTALVLACGDDDAPGTTIRYRWSVGDVLPQILDQRVRTEVPQADDTAPAGRDLATARFTYGYGRAFATAGYGSVNFSRDAFGSTLRTEETLPWTQARAYDAFGLPEPGAEPDRAPATAPAVPRFGYRGELALGPSLHLRARTYDSALGRFTTRDPLSAAGLSSQANNPYTYAMNDPLDRVDPHGTWSVADGPIGALAAILAPAFAATGCAGCGNPGNGIDSHQKCFQGKACLWVRGSLSQSALDADPDTLKSMYLSRRGEAAAQAMTIHELNWRRESVWDSIWDKLWAATTISDKVDWEVGTRGTVPGGFRIDISTEDSATLTSIFEVKRWRGPATSARVTAQLNGYVTIGRGMGIDFRPSGELNDWADGFDVTTGVWSFLRTPWTNDTVYVWGLGEPAGHIYFAKNDKARDDVRSKAQAQHGISGIPYALPVPVPVPVEPVPIPVA